MFTRMIFLAIVSLENFEENNILSKYLSKILIKLVSREINTIKLE